MKALRQSDNHQCGKEKAAIHFCGAAALNTAMILAEKNTKLMTRLPAVRLLLLLLAAAAAAARREGGG